MRFFSFDELPPAGNALRAVNQTDNTRDPLWYGRGVSYLLRNVLVEQDNPHPPGHPEHNPHEGWANLVWQWPDNPSPLAGKWMVIHIPPDGAVINPNAPPWASNALGLQFEDNNGTTEKFVPLTSHYNYINLDDHLTDNTRKVELEHASLTGPLHNSLKLSRLAILGHIGRLRYFPRIKGSTRPKRRSFTALNGVKHVSLMPERLDLQMDFKAHHADDVALVRKLDTLRKFWCWPNGGRGDDPSADWASRDRFAACVVTGYEGFRGVNDSAFGGSFGRVRIQETES